MKSGAVDTEAILSAVENFLADDLFAGIETVPDPDEIKEAVNRDARVLRVRLDPRLVQVITDDLCDVLAKHNARRGADPVDFPVDGRNRPFESWAAALREWAKWYTSAIWDSAGKINGGWEPESMPASTHRRLDPVRGWIDCEPDPESGPVATRIVSRKNRSVRDVVAMSGILPLLKTFHEQREQLRVSVRMEVLSLGPVAQEPVAVAENPTQARKTRGMSLEEANAVAKALLRDPSKGKAFASAKSREWAKTIGCALGTIPDLPAWKATHPKKQKGSASSHKVVSLTPELAQNIDQHGRIGGHISSSAAARDNTELQRLQEGEQTEATRQQAIEQSLKDNEANPSPLDSDPKKRVRARKRV